MIGYIYYLWVRGPYLRFNKKLRMAGTNLRRVKTHGNTSLHGPHQVARAPKGLNFSSILQF
jgi:hypothetical protein